MKITISVLNASVFSTYVTFKGKGVSRRGRRPCARRYKAGILSLSRYVGTWFNLLRLSEKLNFARLVCSKRHNGPKLYRLNLKKTCKYGTWAPMVINMLGLQLSTGCLIVIWFFWNGSEGQKDWGFRWYIFDCMVMRVAHLCFIIQFSKN